MPSKSKLGLILSLAMGLAGTCATAQPTQPSLAPQPSMQPQAAPQPDASQPPPAPQGMQPIPPPQGALPAPPPRPGPGAPPPPPPRDDVAARDAQTTVSGPYRLTYTLTEMDGSKQLGSERYVVILDANSAPTHIDMGARIPVYSSSGSYSYDHIGVRIRATLHRFANGLELITSLGQIELAPDGSSAAHSSHEAQDVNKGRTVPVIRESQMDTVALLTENKPLVLGQLDKPNSTHSLQVTVNLTRVH
jgi:hypothetical protein